MAGATWSAILAVCSRTLRVSPAAALARAKARQALRSAGAGDDAQQHFGLADFGAGHGHAIVAGHGELQPAAQRGAVDGADDRFGTVLDAPQQGVHAMRAVNGNFAVRNRAEDLDIGPGDERVARADEHDGLGGWVGGGARHARVDAFGHAGAQGVYGRIVYGDYGNVILDGVLDEFWHGIAIRSIMALAGGDAATRRRGAGAISRGVFECHHNALAQRNQRGLNLFRFSIVLRVQHAAYHSFAHAQTPGKLGVWYAT